MNADAPYEALAAEYYDERHKTSRNFDAITAEATASWRDRLPAGLVLEVGCGRGRVGEFFGLPSTRVVQLDNSPAMLALPDREPALVRVQHDAETLPFPDAAFGCVIALLSDPFLGLNFLAEAYRVLESGGVLCGTTPSYEWGSTLRETLGIDIMSTRFKLHGGGGVEVPSFLYPAPQLRGMIERVGFGDPIELRAHALPKAVVDVSDDIVRPANHLGQEAWELDVLYTFWATA